MRTLNDLLSIFRTQVLVYMDDHYFCDCTDKFMRLVIMVLLCCKLKGNCPLLHSASRAPNVKLIVTANGSYNSASATETAF